MPMYAKYKVNRALFLMAIERIAFRSLIYFVHTEFHFWDEDKYLIRKSLR
jgi:hypothetical protein